ncbi:MAG: sulfatase/phosphatase domain-containing protein, partial [Planctomycetota bacterium]
TPIQAKKEYISKYQTKAKNMPPITGPRFRPEADVRNRQVQNHPVYAAMVQSVDDCVGRIMTKLDELGIADNTIILFMSDNGGLSTAQGHPTSNLPLRAGKGWLYEGGIREPMIIKWPGTVKPGSVCSFPVTSTDFYPTMLEMASLPLKPQQHRDGVSLVPLLKGAKKLNRQAIYWHYPHYCPQGGRPSGAVRLGDFMLIEYFEDNRVELFNLKQDIGEKNNLSVKMPEKTAQMLKLLKNWQKQMGAKMPTPNPDYKPNGPAAKKKQGRKKK